MMRYMKMLSLACLLCAASSAQASTSAAGYISKIYVMPDGYALFDSSGARDAVAACQGGAVPNRWTFDATTATGQAQLAELLTAYGQHKQIAVVGTNACNSTWVTEKLSYFYTTNDG